VLFWLGFYARISLLWWWCPRSLSIFNFFNSHHFFFQISLVSPSFGFVVDDVDFVVFSGSLYSFTFNFHLFSVCLFNNVQFGLEYLLFQGITLDSSPLLDVNIHLFSSNLLFCLGWSICYSTKCLLVKWDWIRAVGLFFINSSSIYSTLLIKSPKSWWSFSVCSQGLAWSMAVFLRFGAVDCFDVWGSHYWIYLIKSYSLKKKIF